MNGDYGENVRVVKYAGHEYAVRLHVSGVVKIYEEREKNVLFLHYLTTVEDFDEKIASGRIDRYTVGEDGFITPELVVLLRKLVADPTTEDTKFGQFDVKCGVYDSTCDTSYVGKTWITISQPELHDAGMTAVLDPDRGLIDTSMVKNLRDKIEAAARELEAADLVLHGDVHTSWWS